MALGIGRKLKQLGKKAESSVRSAAASARRVGAGIEKLARSGASGVKSGYLHPGRSFKEELSRSGGKLEEASKTALSQASKISLTGQATRAVGRQAKKALTPEEEAPVPIPEPTPMPIPDEALSMVARRRQRARRKGARGSSILSGGQDSLG